MSVLQAATMREASYRMHLTLVGLSHKTAPVEIREKLTFPAQPPGGGAVAAHLDADAVAEAVIVSTCNRTEIYAVTVSRVRRPRRDHRLHRDYHDLDRHELVRYLYISEGEAVVRHLFRVVASLDSMVLGEAQILGQVKEAYDHAFVNGACGRVFNKLFRQSFEVGKRVRTETDIGENAVSISYAAVELAKKVFETLEGRTILVLGAGKMSELTAKHLVSNGVKKVLVANRTYERAQELAEKFDGEAIRYDELFDRMREADIVISSTAATHYVDHQGPGRRGRARAARRSPLFLIDIAVPRDIDPAVNDLADVYLYDIDDLNGVVSPNLEERMLEAERAEVIIDEEMVAFERWLESMEVVPTVAAIRAKAEAIRQAELEKAIKRLGGLSEKELKTVEALTCSIVNKMLHGPTERLKDVAAEKDGYNYVEAARYLYGLDSNPEGKNPHGLGLIKTILGRAARRPLPRRRTRWEIPLASSREKLVIGTRGSKLALWQSEYIKGLVEEITGLPVELKIIKTTGDKILDVPLAKVGGKGLFTKELEVELMAGTVDLCVHSMKDVPTELPEGLYIAAMPERVDPRDALVSRRRLHARDAAAGRQGGHELASPHRAGARASPRRRDRRRARQPRHPHAQGRGRASSTSSSSRRPASPAWAGPTASRSYIPTEQMVSAVGQGAIGIEIREDDEFMRDVMREDLPRRHVHVRDRRARRHAQARGRLPGADRRVRASRRRHA